MLYFTVQMLVKVFLEEKEHRISNHVVMSYFIINKACKSTFRKKRRKNLNR